MRECSGQRATRRRRVIAEFRPRRRLGETHGVKAEMREREWRPHLQWPLARLCSTAWTLRGLLCRPAQICPGTDSFTELFSPAALNTLFSGKQANKFLPSFEDQEEKVGGGGLWEEYCSDHTGDSEKRGRTPGRVDRGVPGSSSVLGIVTVCDCTLWAPGSRLLGRGPQR